MDNSTGPEATRGPTDAPRPGTPAEDTRQPQAGTDPEAQAEPRPAEEALASPGAAAAAGAAQPGRNKLFEAARQKLRLDVGNGEGEKLKAELEATRAELDEARDKHVRLLAEMENLRRRTEREKLDISKYAISKFARDVLEVADNFQRAVGTVPAEIASAEGPARSFLEGVQLTERQLQGMLERHGVKRIDPVGLKFDPNVHQAMMEMESAEVPAGMVLQAYQPAYVIEDRVLRPAMVVVSKGPPRPPQPAPAPVSDAPAPAEPVASAPANDDAPAAADQDRAEGRETGEGGTKSGTA